ncbi:alkaline phosphatase [Subtercola frigoramans]|uniref:Alkaline phosphatase n=1 Tax=Subtercola frigoramans TaxID=120298 RepID=A0ABS2L8X5_9MICO|nr:alkaline phosphatase [Subtercola frigoramans]MBM7473546.1 alkaline phosphatase [Subtercola frigoramans]
MGGTKTYDNAISVDIDGAPHDTLIEIAKANGLKTGNISTAEIEDATPAVQAAHVAARSCFGPDDLAKCGTDAIAEGGLGSIAEQIIDTRADLTLGGGSRSFAETANAGQFDGSTLFEQASDRGYQLAATGPELAAISTANQTEPVLGLFSEGNFPTRYAATAATVGGADLAPATCTANPERLPSDLSLKSLTDKGISLLNKDNESGFFLQVEGASIDKQDHAANACGQIGETIDLDEAVQSALAFAKADGNTLVIVTADHAHSSQIVDTTPPTSLSTALLTHDGTTMKVSYGTAGLGGSQQHTGSQLRIAAYGPGAANVVGLTDQTDNFFTMSRALELNLDTASLSEGATVAVSNSTVKPGAALTVSASGFAGDRQVSGTVASEPVALDETDVIDSSARFAITAPDEVGTHTVTVTGSQSGVSAQVTFTVDPNAATPTSTPSASPSASPSSSPSTAAASGSGSGPGSTGGFTGINLASTGAVVVPVLLVGGALLSVGAVLIIRRRRAQHEV